MAVLNSRSREEPDGRTCRIERTCPQRLRHRHAAGGGCQGVCSLLHDEADRPGHGPRPVDALRVRQAVRRAGADTFRDRARYDRRDLPSAPPERGRDRGGVAGRGVVPAPAGRRDCAGGGRRADPAHAGDGRAGRPRLHCRRGGGRGWRPQGPAVRRADRPAHHGCGPARRPQRPPDGRRGPGDMLGPEGAVHHGVRRERAAQRWTTGNRDVHPRQTVRERQPRRPHPRVDCAPSRRRGCRRAERHRHGHS